MHDVRAIRDTPDAWVAGWSARGVEDAAAVVARILELDRDARAAQTRAQEALAQRNAASRAIGAAMGRKDTAEAERLKAEVEALKGGIAEAEAQARTLKAELDGVLAALPNLAAADVPEGEDESGNVEVGAWGQPRRTGPAKDHADLGEALGLLDFEAAARMSGARFAVLKGGLARLERAIGQFMLDLQTGRHGYVEVNPPYLVRDAAMFGTGQLPKFGEDLFYGTSVVNPPQVSDDLDRSVREWRNFIAHSTFSSHASTLRQFDKRTWHRLNSILSANDPVEFKRFVSRARIPDFQAQSERRWLIPTAEVSLTNLVREQILAEEELAEPMRLTALTPCFRAEAGSAGRDTRGLIRQHQFSKVELVSIARPEDSEAEHERMTGCAEAVLEALDLPYRTIVLCTGDMGFGARITHDLEVWLPGQNTYREISSVSYCGDFQARRMNARYRPASGGKPEFVHTLNGSGLAVGRALIAVLENGQHADGSVDLPAALHPYLGGATRLSAEGRLA